MSSSSLAEGPYVLDASVVLAYMLEEAAGGPFVRAFREFLVAASRCIVPLHFDLECASGLVRAVRRRRVDEGEALDGLLMVLDLPLMRTASAAGEIDALRLALEYDISVYDAGYVALSEESGLPLLTADVRLWNSLRGGPHDVRLLEDATA